MRVFAISARIVAVGIVFAAIFGIAPWWFTLIVGIPLFIDAFLMLHGVIGPAR
jgi:hypothetical protein